MKVMFIANYQERSGWSEAARNYILALDAAGVEVVPRPLVILNNRVNLCERIKELEYNSAAGCDTVIQMTLPPLMRYDGHFKRNVGIVCTETNNLEHTTWHSAMNNMDMIITPNDAKLNLNCLHRVVPIPVDTEKFHKSYEKWKLNLPEDTFVFYFISEITERKNILALLRAYHGEFDRTDNTALIIKGCPTGMSPADGQQYLAEQFNLIKANLKKYPQAELHLPEYIITDYLTDERVLALHASCDCFVMPSRGEAWSIPCMDAMGFGNIPIVTANTGMCDFITDETGYIVNSSEQPCFSAMDTMPELATCRQTWQDISVRSLQVAMRQAYENRQDNPKRQAGKEEVYNYSYEAVGNMLKHKLEEL